MKEVINIIQEYDTNKPHNEIESLLVKILGGGSHISDDVSISVDKLIKLLISTNICKS